MAPEEPSARERAAAPPSGERPAQGPPAHRPMLPPLSRADRVRAWLVTGPLARMYGFLSELAIALFRAATGRPQSED